MQSFVTDSCLLTCVKNLDNKRLGKQRLEGLQMLNSIYSGSTRGLFHNHCTKMWKNHPLALQAYINFCIQEWIFRGFKNTMKIFPEYSEQMPDWFYWKSLQRSHRANLLRKNLAFYKDKFIKTPQDYEILRPYLYCGYLWPTKLTEEQYRIASEENVDPKEICDPINLAQLVNIPDLQVFINHLDVMVDKSFQ